MDGIVNVMYVAIVNNGNDNILQSYIFYVSPVVNVVIKKNQE